MDGTRYPDGVLVTSPALTRTETSKSFQILQNRLINWETGVFVGGEVTVNAVNQNRVDIAPLQGIAPNGELVVVPEVAGPGSAGALNVALADTTLGAVNYVYAFYVELGDQPMPHETNGRTYTTQTVASFQISVLTLSQFQLLPLTDPSYAQLARDRALLIGIVTGTGGNLTQGSIEQTVPWRTLKFATQGAPVMPGVTITAVSDDTPDGDTGALIFTPGPPTLAWQAPTESGPGLPVATPTEGYYTLTALGGSTIQVYVVITSLPSLGQNTQVTITGLYAQRLPRESNTDRHHRSLVGSGIPTPQNPHGLSIDDIAPGFVNELERHQELEHANGIWRGSSPTCLRVTVSENAGVDSVVIQAPVGVDTFYIFGKRLTSIVNTTVTFTDLIPVETQKQVYTIYVDVSGNVKKSKRASFQSALPSSTGTENNFIFISDDIVAGTYNLTYVSAGFGLGGTLQWGSGPPITVPGTISPLTGALFRLRDGFTEAWFFVGDVGLFLARAAGTYVDAIDVFDLVDLDENLQLGQVSWSGAGSGDLGYTPNRGATAARMVDSRLFGTLRDFHIRDDTLIDKLEVPLAEHSPDGVVVGQVDFFDQRGSLYVVPAGGLLVDVLGFAPVYVRGRRLMVAGQSNLPINNDNAVTILYVDAAGVFRQTDVTFLPAFLTPAKGIWRVDLETHAPYGAAIALVTTAGGVVTDVIDLRRNLSGGNVSIIPWSVGSARQGAVDILGEFLDLRGAALYASYTSRVPILTLLDVTLEKPVTFAGPVVIQGGILRLGVDLFLTNPAAAITFSLSPFSGLDTQVVLRDVQVIEEVGLAGSTSSALVRQTYLGQVLLDACSIDLSVSLHSIVRVSISNGSARVIRTTIRSSAGGQGPIVHFDASGTFEAQNVVLTDIAAMAALVRLVASVTVVANVRGVSGSSVTPMVNLGAGATIADSLFDEVRNMLLPTGSGNYVRSRFRGLLMPGGTWAGLTDVLVENCSFSSALVFSSPTRLRVAQSKVTSGQITVDSGTDVWLEQVTTIDNLRLEGTLTNVLVRQCRFAGSSKGIYCGEAGSFFIANLWVDGCTFELFECIFAGQTLLRNIVLTGCVFRAADITPTAANVLEGFRVQGCYILVHVFVSNPGSFLSQDKADVCIYDNIFDAGGTPGSPVEATMVLVAAGSIGVQVRGNTFRGVTAPSSGQGVLLFGSGVATAQRVPEKVAVEGNFFVIQGDPAPLAGITDFGPSVICFHGDTRVARVARNRFFFDIVTVHMVTVLAAAGPDQISVTDNVLEFPTGTGVQWILPSATVPAAHQIALFITVADFPLQTPDESGYTYAGPQINAQIKNNTLWTSSFALINAFDFVLAQLAAQAAGPQATIQVIGNSSGAASNTIVPAGATTAHNT